MPVVRTVTRLRRQECRRDFATTLRQNATDAERLLWSLLRDRRSNIRFRRQQPVGPYIADFFCASARLIVELDGDQHGESAILCYDEIRTRFLNSRGYRVLRVPNHEVFRDPHAVVETILRIAGERAPRVRPHPEKLSLRSNFSTLPQGEGGSSYKSP
ncbi:MAG: endonuclease domain-containing protein [Alphaproteobacteria bacterium]|nr:endonuclease domain-containing protein [Alphaproteobacteria bacterium]